MFSTGSQNIRTLCRKHSMCPCVIKTTNYGGGGTRSNVDSSVGDYIVRQLYCILYYWALLCCTMKKWRFFISPRMCNVQGRPVGRRIVSSRLGRHFDLTTNHWVTEWVEDHILIREWANLNWWGPIYVKCLDFDERLDKTIEYNDNTIKLGADKQIWMDVLSLLPLSVVRR